jgi:hypothetical protein
MRAILSAEYSIHEIRIQGKALFETDQRGEVKCI